MSCQLLTCYCLSQSKCLLLRPRPRRRRSPLQHGPPSLMLSPASTPSIYTSEYVSPLLERQISFMKSTLWPLRGYLGRKTDPSVICAGTWGSIQEESTKGYQRDSGICCQGDGMWTGPKSVGSPNRPPSLLICLLNARELKTSALTLNSTRKSGRRVSKVCHTDCA